MFDKPISPLRQRMIDDMTARRLSEATQKDYVRNVRNFTAFLGQSPDTATSDDLGRMTPSTLNRARTSPRSWGKTRGTMFTRRSARLRRISSNEIPSPGRARDE